MIIFEAVLFVLSSGLLFSKRFRDNTVLVICAGLIALVASYFLGAQILAMWNSPVTTSPSVQITPAATPSMKQAITTLPPTSSSSTTSAPAAPPPSVRFYFPNIEAVRTAINNLTENTTQEQLAELFGPPTSRKSLEREFKGEKAEIFAFQAGPYSVAVARTKSFFVGYGIAVSREPDAAGITPVIFLSRGSSIGWNGSAGLESLELGRIRGNCDDWMNGAGQSEQTGKGKFWVISARQPIPAASPKCYFGRAGQYANYSFVYPLANVHHDSGVCVSEFARIEEPGIMNRLECPDYKSLKPLFVFMSKEDIDVQQWTASVFDALYIL